ncbi:tetratricopeptide repeat protein [Streptomyces liangshanensis]|uniref:tetratricopeptide repeat protein n=1 Tax=Streptomyces liangshanensis TaxID=2717324 RepID=UPI0036DDFDA4
MSAVVTFLGAVGAGMANEYGRRLNEAVGGMVARVAGREVTAPAGQADREAVARVLVAEARRDPGQARLLGSLMSGLPDDRTAEGPAPRSLRAPGGFFTDRREALTLLRKEATRKADGRPRVAVVFGLPGYGSSELAAFFGAKEAALYPDGTLYADLRGASAGTAPTASVLLRDFLLKLHVAPDRVPPATEDRAERLRALLGARRLLVVLDHAQSAAQVRPLITGAPGVFTIVVAARPLTGLDAVPVPVGPLKDRDARLLLGKLVSKQALTAARATLPAVLERCAGSPFALRAIAPQLAVPGPGSVRAVGPGSVPAPVPGSGASAGTGSDSGSGAAGEPNPVRSVTEELYRQLPPEQARLYRTAALRPWPALTAAAVAASAAVSEREAAQGLAELAERRLLEELPDGRYRFRPAIRAHAVEAATREDGLARCAAAVARAVDHYVRFAVRADFAALRERPHVDPLFDELGPGEYEDEGAALTALTAELGNVVESVLAAEEFGDFGAACRGTEALWAVQLKAGRHEAVLPALRAGVRAAEQRFPGTEMAGRMHTQLAFALMETPSGYDEAERELEAAADAEERAGHLRGQATVIESLGLLRLRQWRFAPALASFDVAGRLLDGIAATDRDARHLPRARALLERHRGRALRGLGRFAPARQRLAVALEFFRAPGTAEPYNEARVLTDQAETEYAAGDHATALRQVEEAAAILRGQQATAHLDYLDMIRRECLAGRA